MRFEAIWLKNREIGRSARPAGNFLWIPRQENSNPELQGLKPPEMESFAAGLKPGPPSEQRNIWNRSPIFLRENDTNTHTCGERCEQDRRGRGGGEACVRGQGAARERARRGCANDSR